MSEPTFDWTRPGGAVSAVIYWPCAHRRPLRWWHRLRGQGTHLVYLDHLAPDPDVSDNSLTLTWDPTGRFRVDDVLRGDRDE